MEKNYPAERKEYLGIPVMSDDEQERLLFIDMLESEVDGFSIVKVGQLITGWPSVSDFIKFDQETWYREDRGSEVFSEKEALGYMQAMQAGYSVVFGVITLLGYMREGDDDIYSYLKNLPQNSGCRIPVRRYTFDRARLIRQGGGVLEQLLYDEVEDSSVLAYANTGDVFMESVHLNVVIDDLCERELVKSEVEIDIFESGFMHGTIQAIQLAVLSAESSSLEAYFKD